MLESDVVHFSCLRAPINETLVHLGWSRYDVFMPRRYAAIMMGTYNCAQNLTYYALANNAIGLSLDRGRCPSDDLADPVTPEEQASCTLAWYGTSYRSSCLWGAQLSGLNYQAKLRILLTGHISLLFDVQAGAVCTVVFDHRTFWRDLLPVWVCRQHRPPDRSTTAREP